MSKIIINNEEFYPLKRNNNYIISKNGVVYSKDKICFDSRFGNYLLKGKKIKQTIKDNYITVVINKKQTYIHILLYETFIGNIPKGYVIHHKDFNPLNNKLDNLICISRSEHIALHNKTTRNDMYGKRKCDLTIEQKRKLIELSLLGLSNRKVASIVGCGKSTVQRLYKEYLEREGA